jgi:ribA/ribD-fused uncharacterized protein
MNYNLKWLTDKFDNGETLRYIFFWGHSNKNNEDIGKFVFSQWYPSLFVVDDIEYKTAEHWMMAHKALLFDDTEVFRKILRCDKPGEVKELGRQIRGFDEIKWNKYKFKIVRAGNIHKFNQNKNLRDFLMGTDNKIIVEASPADVVWGIGLSQDAEMIDNPYTWRGENLLGFALMEARNFLKDFGDFEYSGFKMQPPWKKFPDIDPLDIFWRMGIGESYVMDFGKYFADLSSKEKARYELVYPASGDWSDYYSQ